MARRSNRKAQILELATDLFSRGGYDKVTVRQLADACGITEPAIYRHYESKEAIFNSVLDSLQSRIDCTELFDQLREESDIDKLLSSLAHHIIEFHAGNTDIYRLMLFSSLSGHSHAKKIFDLIRGTYVRFLVKQLDRLREEKLIIQRNNEITARCFIGMVFDCALSTTLWRGMLGKNFKPRETVDNNIPIYVRGLSA